jgi:hypothetical protein
MAARLKKVVLITAGLMAMAAAAVLVMWDTPRNGLELLLERHAIEQTTRDYFKAEMERDYRKVYSLLAPSSTYRKTHTYEEFLQDMSGSPVVIKSYRIVDIYRLRGNHDPAAYPAVKRFVQVEVDVDVGFADSSTTSTCNYCFTFLKEGGRWYKG